MSDKPLEPDYDAVKFTGNYGDLGEQEEMRRDYERELAEWKRSHPDDGRMSGWCEICGEQAALDRHHRKRRSQGGDDSPANIMEICRACHNIIHADPGLAYVEGYLVRSFLDPAEIQVERKGGHDQLAPGQECPSCKRRIPHPKKPSSPKSKVFSFRVPLDDAETTHELVKSAAEHLGIYEKPNWQYNTLLHGLVLTLQEP